MSASFDLGEVEAEIAETRFRGSVVHFASAGSTNQLALEAALGGARGGVWVADEQTAGRGRGGHEWHSAAGDGLYVSALVTPGVPLSHAASIPLAAGLAAQAAVLEVTGLAAEIRWPNDLMFGSKKFGGILVESASEAAGSRAGEPKLRFAVIGVGINVHHANFPPELKDLATSLHLESGRRFAREPLLAALLRHLDSELSRMDAAYAATEAGSDLLRRFEASSGWVRGKHVRVEEAGGYTGWTCGLNREGFLLVQGDDGILRTVLSGGVRPA